MADQNTRAALQYFDYQLVTKQSPGINDRYTDIINYVPVKIPYYNDSFRTEFNQVEWESPDGAYISFIKRMWFDRISLWDWNTGETDLVEDTNPNKWMFTDCQFIEGARYMMAVYYDYSRMRIYKQISVWEIEWCGNYNNVDVATGNFVNITKYNGKYYFPFSKCLYQKFVFSQFGRWKSTASWVNWRVRNELMWDYIEIQTIFYDPIVWNIWAWPWDYMCLYDGNLATQVNYISSNGVSSVHSPVVSDCLLMKYPFFWMYRVKVWDKTTTLTGTTASDTVVESSDTLSEESSDQKRKVFSDYWDVLSFVTADGIFILNYSNVKPSETEFTYEGSTHFDTNFWSNPPTYIISSMASFDDSIYFIDIKSGRLLWWLQWVDKFYFDTRNAFEFGKNYTEVVSCWYVLLLIWDSKFSLVNPTQWANTDGTPDGTVDFWWFMVLNEDIWYYSRDSFFVEDTTFYIINSRWRLFWRTFTMYYSKIIPAPQEIPLWYLSDLTVLRKWREDVSLYTASGDIFIFISEQKIDNSQIKWNTKVHLFSSRSALRYKRMIPGVVLRWFKHNTRFGNNIYSHQWNKDYNSFSDSDQYFKTILKVQVGYENLNYTKNIAYTRTILWYNSYVTKWKTLVKHNIDLWWWHWELKYGDLWRDDYVTNIMKLRKTWNTGNDFKNYPIWIAMKWGNWVGLASPETRYLEEEFNAFNSYYPTNESISDELADFTVSKMSTFQINLNLPVDHMWIEYITFDDNALEIAWVLVGYTIDNINQVRLPNNATQQDSADSWPSSEPLTPDSGDESVVA